MFRRIPCALVVLFAALSITAHGQSKNRQKIFTSDIDNFWIAFDSVQSTKDSLQQLHFIQTLYVDKGTPGLKAFMKVRDYTPELWVHLINKYPAFWKSVRPNTYKTKRVAKQIEKSIRKLKKLYPDLRDAKMYFTIGGLRSGGTTMQDMVLIGAEIATGDSTTVAPNNWLAGVFKDQKEENIVTLNIHEYIHTQQQPKWSDHLLGLAIREGACDFISELVMNQPLQNNYIKYGRAHEAELKAKFKEEMYGPSYNNWLYNGTNAKTVADLGYFMGYAICKSYYDHAANKKQAIKDIIELDYDSDAAVDSFLIASKYYSEPIDKAALVKKIEEMSPKVVRLEPLLDGNEVDPAVKEVKVVFSEPMRKNGYSISYGEKGKEAYPVTAVEGYSDDGLSLTLKLDLKPGREYEFVLASHGFSSEKGYALKPYTVRFRTKE